MYSCHPIHEIRMFILYFITKLFSNVITVLCEILHKIAQQDTQTRQQWPEYNIDWQINIFGHPDLMGFFPIAINIWLLNQSLVISHSPVVPLRILILNNNPQCQSFSCYSVIVLSYFSCTTLKSTDILQHSYKALLLYFFHFSLLCVYSLICEFHVIKKF